MGKPGVRVYSVYGPHTSYVYVTTFFNLLLLPLIWCTIDTYRSTSITSINDKVVFIPQL